MAREPGEDGCAIAQEAQRDQAGMVEQTLNERHERAEREPVAGRERRRRRPVLGARAMVAGAEDDGERTASGRGATATPRAGPRSASPLARWMPCRLAGRVAASLAMTRSPGLNRVASAARGRCRIPPSASTASSRADRRSGRSAAIMARTSTGRAAWPALRRAATSTISAAASSGRFKRRRIGVGHRQRVQRRVHVAGVDREETDAVGLCLLGPDCRQVVERRLAGAVGAPAG